MPMRPQMLKFKEKINPFRWFFQHHRKRIWLHKSLDAVEDLEKVVKRMKANKNPDKQAKEFNRTMDRATENAYETLNSVVIIYHDLITLTNEMEQASRGRYKLETMKAKNRIETATNNARLTFNDLFNQSRRMAVYPYRPVMPAGQSQALAGRTVTQIGEKIKKGEKLSSRDKNVLEQVKKTA